ncbi:MarR family transcriptional regulator [Janibacter cremeus]|uniref:DNA-binding MarR family transcriptional regulator n=1 Tax=Janibacter cremeus TaxID=1285192 RepID=A0A852VM73_9MICO|nr:DNA-binding MarR family transcriptional regulator [Janibacter cremeus]
MHATIDEIGLPLQETLGRVFGQFSRLIVRRQTLDPTAMSRTDYSLLAALEHCHHEAGMRTSHLAQTQGQDASTVSRRLGLLETQGHIERLADPSDGRASTVRLTPAGRTALSDERTARTDLIGAILTDWPHDDLADLDRLLTRLSEDLAADAGSAGPSPSPSVHATGKA